MKLSRKYSDVPEFNMLALLDIIFLIVIFCIVGMTRMVFLEIVEVKNPELQISQQVETKDFVTITITKEGEIYGDTDAPLGDALHILQTVREANLSKVYFKADSSGKS